MDIKKEEQYIALKQKFDAYYNDTLKPILQKNDAVRHKYVLMFLILLAMSVVLYPLIIRYIISEMLVMQDTSGAGVILGLSGFLIMILCGPMYMYKCKAKSMIMPDFANFFGDFEYTYEQAIDNSVLQKSQLFKPFMHNFGDDFFSGVYDNVHITIAEEELSESKLNPNNNGGWISARNRYGRTFGRNRTDENRTYKTVFKGICVLLEMNKNFAGQTVVLQDRGILNAFYRVKGLERVRLEDSKFEKIFEVFSHDQIEARYLLTTAFMERMLKLRDLYDGKLIQFSFTDNKLLIAVQTKQNMFEANSFFRSNMNKKKIDLVFDQFYTVFSIIEILKLNQRLGM